MTWQCQCSESARLPKDAVQAWLLRQQGKGGLGDFSQGNSLTDVSRDSLKRPACGLEVGVERETLREEVGGGGEGVGEGRCKGEGCVGGKVLRCNQHTVFIRITYVACVPYFE
jgi:hypothetical protein